MNAYPAARYRLDFVATTPVRLPEYAGSALRGAFGHALKRTVCVTREPECKACALYRSCAYPAVFAPPAPESHRVQKFSEIPAPYVIEPPPWGARAYEPGAAFHVHLVLIGTANRHLPLIVHAFARAFEHGVGAGDGRARLAGVAHIAPDGSAAPLRAPDTGRLREAPVGLPAPQAPAPATLTLELLTPLRLQANGKPIAAADLSPGRFVIGVIKRAALLAEFHAGQPLDLDFRALAAHAETLTTAEKNLHWRDWGRYSSRQQREMKLGGVTGQWTIAGELTPFWPYLYWGQWLHVGKETVFGLGHYRIAD